MGNWFGKKQVVAVHPWNHDEVLKKPPSSCTSTVRIKVRMTARELKELMAQVDRDWKSKGDSKELLGRSILQECFKGRWHVRVVPSPDWVADYANGRYLGHITEEENLANLVKFFDIGCEIPELKGDNYKMWKERVLLYLGWMDIDYAIRKDEPPAVTNTSTEAKIALYEHWEQRSNRLSVLFIKTKISTGIRGSVDQHTKVCDLLKAIDEQFITSYKVLAST
ncbi:hypothetical protein F0562_014931 [Nyssa sinensis]|uniref:Uncharacterized protein n=1 Tax=Nyssa sinensis TaxID=561372 RepID=A0A5J4ZUK1_9ASTE|nr:hypothetical protein F0562_014931 [Nyssa sinensis]